MLPYSNSVLDCLQKDTSSSLAATKELTGLLDKERKDWKIRQTEMVKQIADLQEECRSVTIEIVSLLAKHIIGYHSNRIICSPKNTFLSEKRELVLT